MPQYLNRFDKSSPELAESLMIELYYSILESTAVLNFMDFGRCYGTSFKKSISCIDENSDIMTGVIDVFGP